MFKTGQHVEITSPRLLEILARRKSKPFGTVVAVDPQAEYPDCIISQVAMMASNFKTYLNMSHTPV